MLFAAQLIALDTLPYNSMEKYATNSIDAFCSNNEWKKKKNFPPLSHIMESRYKRYVTYGIREKLKRSDLMDSSTCRYVVNYVI